MIDLNNLSTDAEIEAAVAVGVLEQHAADLSADMLDFARSTLPSIASIAAQFDAALKGTGTNPEDVSAVQKRYLAQLGDLTTSAIVRVQEHMRGMEKAMAPPKLDAGFLELRRDRIGRVLVEPGDVLQAYYDAAEAKDDASMQAIETAPQWDKAFALSDDQRRTARRARWGDRASALEAAEDVRFHMARIAETVRRHIDGAQVDNENIDALLSR